MVFLNDSLNVVLVGDWNRLYMQPDWMAEHVFEKEEIEICINGQDLALSMAYRSGGVMIAPNQSNVVFSVTGIGDEIDNLCRCLNNFIEKAYTPQPLTYGLNADFMEEDGTPFAEVLDAMSDTIVIAEEGYEIISTNISRVLKLGNKTIGMDSTLENNILKIHFNEEHTLEESKINFYAEDIKTFLKTSKDILCGLGYEFGGDE